MCMAVTTHIHLWCNRSDHWSMQRVKIELLRFECCICRNFSGSCFQLCYPHCLSAHVSYVYTPLHLSQTGVSLQQQKKKPQILLLEHEMHCLCVSKPLQYTYTTHTHVCDDIDKTKMATTKVQLLTPSHPPKKKWKACVLRVREGSLLPSFHG